MKKSTILLLLLAVIAGGLTWYFEIKHPHKEASSSEVLKPVFSFNADDITSVNVQRQGEDVLVERQGNGWQITQPVNSRADRSVIESLIASLSSAMVERKFSTQPSGLATYGLAQPAITLHVKLKNGSQHRISLGAKDFNGTDVYALVDGAPDIYLFSSSLLTNADKGLQDLRDNAILDYRSPDITSFEIRNAQGDFVLSKQDDEWHLERPQSFYGDDSQVLALLSRIGAVTSEKVDDLGKYGLNNPSITFTAKDKTGKSYQLLIGKKSGGDYYAQDTSRQMVFLIHGDLYNKLDVGMQELRDKKLLHVAESELTKVEIRNANQTLVCLNKGGNWIIEQPAAQARKEAMTWKFLLPLLNARATEILDRPSAAIAASLSKPEIEATLTPKSGQALHVVISQPDGDYVYAHVNAGTSIFKMGKQIYDELNFSAADVVMAAPSIPAAH